MSYKVLTTQSMTLRRFVFRSSVDSLDGDVVMAENNSGIGRVKFSGKLQIKVGERLPDLALRSTRGKQINLLEESKEGPIVVFFYPGDGAGITYPELVGCTLEARSFR